eukprot:g3643.t1
MQMPRALAGREEEATFPRPGVWVVKIQPPLDVSSDSAGGIGRITPTTLTRFQLVSMPLVFLEDQVREEDEGHFPLLRCALSEARQVAYRYAEEFEEEGQKLRVYTEVMPAVEHMGSHHPPPEAQLPAYGVSSAVEGEEVRKMEDPEVLACFLDLGEDGLRSHRLWTENLEQVPLFDVRKLSRDRVAGAWSRQNPDEFFPYKGKDVWYTCRPDVPMDPRCAATGLASEKGCPPSTLPQLLKTLGCKCGSKPALRVERPCPALGANGEAPPALPEEAWKTWSWRDYYEDARKAGKGFVKCGLQPFETVAVWGFNAPEWMLSTYAASMAAGKSAGLYPTDTPETAAFKVAHSGASLVVLEDEGKLKKLVAALTARPMARMKVKAFITYAYEPEEGKRVEVKGASVPVISWAALTKLGASDSELDAKLEGRSAMVCSFMKIAGEHMGFCRGPNPERILSYLPLSHVAGLMVDIAFPVVASATTSIYATTFFARSYDLKQGTLKDRLCVARPTAFLGALVTWAKDQALAKAKSHQLAGDGSTPLGFGFADKLVLSKVKGALGLDQLKLGLTGAAPIRVDTLEFFGSLGIQVNETYGMSESTGGATISTSLVHLWGSCGFQLPGVEVKAFKVDPEDVNVKTECPLANALDSLDEACQGELCFRGRNIMMGYLAQDELGPEHVKEIEGKTAGTIDKEGWLHSGDKGIEGGENIAPVPIEDHIKACCDGINEVLMIGDKRKFNVALITLKAVGANGETPGTNQLDAGAVRVNPSVKTITEAMDDQVWIETITAAVQKTNANGKVCPNNAFKIQKFMVLPTNFSEEQGFLTPTKKMKRPVVSVRVPEDLAGLDASLNEAYPFCLISLLSAVGQHPPCIGLMTAWSEAPGRGILEPTTKGSASCPRCGDTLLSDSRFCRCCGHALGTDLGAPYTEDSNSATDGLQFLCSKYSALITRLREEVLAHQQAQAECRRLERRLREESQSWAQEKEQLMLDLQRLRVEVDSLNRLAERQRADAPCKPAREHGAKELHPQPVKPAEADTNAWHQYEAQQKQHQQMMSLLNEHSQLQVETRDAQDELTACRDHLARWRRKATDLETQKMTAERHREDAEKKARCMQDELRQALRSASLAKSRQKEAERVAKQELWRVPNASGSVRL